jgi:hypothetical protein
MDVLLAPIEAELLSEDAEDNDNSAMAGPARQQAAASKPM